MAGVPKFERENIEHAALLMFADQGFESTTMSAIAEAAGLSRRSLYRYFTSKEDIFFEYHRRETLLLERILGDATRSLSDGLRQFARTLVADDEALALRLRVLEEMPKLRARSLMTRSEWEAMVARNLACRNGSDEPTLEMRIVAAAAMGSLSIAVQEWVYRGADLDESLDRALAFVDPLLMQVQQHS